MNKIILILGILIFIFSNTYTVSACGWFTDERNGNRIWYNEVDEIVYVEDWNLLMTRMATEDEIELNSMSAGEGWMQYEDNPTRIYYDSDSKLTFIQDDILGNRAPNSQEKELNIYILQSYSPEDLNG